MPCYVGLDSSKRTTAICVLDDQGATVREGTVASDPKAIVGFLRGEGRRYARVGMESWSLASWLYEGLARAGLPIICIEAGHAHRFLKEWRVNKTDRNDARGIAELMRINAYKTVHIKTQQSRQSSALISVRKLLLRKVCDIEHGIGSTLLLFGLKLNSGGRSTFERRVRALVRSDAFLASLLEPLMAVRAHNLEALHAFERRLQEMADADPVCRRLMTAPAVGAITALMFRAVIDEPRRFTRSRNVGPHLGLTAATWQSGKRKRTGGISKHGDKGARTALYLAASYQLRRDAKPSWLRDWGLEVAARRGRKKATVAIARRLAVTLHQMWITESDFRWTAKGA
jgi:transposase